MINARILPFQLKNLSHSNNQHLLNCSFTNTEKVFLKPQPLSFDPKPSSGNLTITICLPYRPVDLVVQSTSSEGGAVIAFLHCVYNVSKCEVFRQLFNLSG